MQPFCEYLTQCRAASVIKAWLTSSSPYMPVGECLF